MQIIHSMYSPANAEEHQDQPNLLCKPLPGMKQEEILFCYKRISFRSLCLPGDIPLIYQWVNQSYARRYWQMDGTKKQLLDTYKIVLAHRQAHSFIGTFEDQVVCQVDLYNVAIDELAEHVEVSPGSCGLHILMLPPSQSSKGLTTAMLKALIRFYFSFGAAQTLYGEPDARNTGANVSAKAAGFTFLRPITLSYKTANLYSITKQQFHATYPIL